MSKNNISVIDLHDNFKLSDIPFDDVFNTPQGQFLLFTHKKDLFNLYKEFLAYEDICYCDTSPEVIEEHSRIFKLTQSTKKKLKVEFHNSLEVKQELKKFYNQNIKEKGMDPTGSKDFLKWYYSLNLSFQIPNYEHSSRSPMTVMEDLVNYLKESLKKTSFWIFPKDLKKGNESNFYFFSLSR
jgi:hypothetical protein